jgi:hypothetical protein
VAALLTVASWCGAQPAAANGNHAHEAVTLRAIELLPSGPLQDLVRDPAVREALLNGSIFPDGGYAISHPYGETAHWEPFQRAMLRHLRDRHPQLESDPLARPKLAFLLGMFSHGMADQVYDALFMDSAHQIDAATWSDGLLESFDTATDIFWVLQAGASPLPAPWLPLDDILAVFEARGEPVPAETVQTAQQILTQVVLAFPKNKAADPKTLPIIQPLYPWAWDHLTDPHEPGNPLCEARVVAAYWQQIWEELHGAPPRLRVLATIPSEGGVHPAAQAKDPRSKVAVVMSRGLDQGKLPADALVVRDAKGQVLAATQDLFYGHGSHVLRLVPKQDWPTGQPLTLQVAAGLRAFDGTESTASEQFTFTAGGPSTAEPGQPPKGSPWQLKKAATVAVTPAPAEPAGCQMARADAAPRSAWLLPMTPVLVVALWRRRRLSAAG